MSGGLELVLSHAELLCLALYYIQLSTNIKINNHKIKITFLAHVFGISGMKKLVLIFEL